MGSLYQDMLVEEGIPELGQRKTERFEKFKDSSDLPFFCFQVFIYLKKLKKGLDVCPPGRCFSGIVKNAVHRLLAW